MGTGRRLGTASENEPKNVLSVVAMTADVRSIRSPGAGARDLLGKAYLLLSGVALLAAAIFGYFSDRSSTVTTAFGAFGVALLLVSALWSRLGDGELVLGPNQMKIPLAAIDSAERDMNENRKRVGIEVEVAANPLVNIVVSSTAAENLNQLTDRQQDALDEVLGALPLDATGLNASDLQPHLPSPYFAARIGDLVLIYRALRTEEIDPENGPGFLLVSVQDATRQSVLEPSSSRLPRWRRFMGYTS
jgi:hypothetical protein